MFEGAKLDGYLRGALGVHGEMRIEQVAGGQSNPTYYVTYDDRRLVLRKQPAQVLPSVGTRAAPDAGLNLLVAESVRDWPVSMEE